MDNWILGNEMMNGLQNFDTLINHVFFLNAVSFDFLDTICYHQYSILVQVSHILNLSSVITMFCFNS